MAAFFGLLFSLLLLALVFLPILTFIRLVRISRELQELRERVGELESNRRVRSWLSQPAATTGTSADTTAAPAPETTATASTAAAVVTASAPAASAATEPLAAAVSTPAAVPGAPSAPGAPAAPSAPGQTSSPGDLEERIGSRGLLYTGVFVLLLGVSFFLKYAFDNQWINETARTLIGLVAGVGLIVGGLRLATSGLTTFGHALVGTGFAVLYLVVYAALNFYFLIDRPAAFAMMTLVTCGAAAIAHRRETQPIAVIAVGGGFLTPALVGGDENAQLTLFTYDAMLVIGTMLLAFRHQWPVLNVISFVGTFVTVLAWADRYYTDALWLRTLLFLTLFCVAFLIIVRETRRRGTRADRIVSWLLMLAPFFYHLAAIVMTAGHPPAIHIYLIAFTAVGLWLAVEPYRPWLRLVVLLGALIPMFGSLTLPDGGTWLLANVITIVAVTLLHVMALVDRVMRQDEALSGVDLLTLHVSGLGVFSLLYETLQGPYPEFRGALALLIALGALLLGRALRPRDELAWLNAIGLSFTLIAIGIAVQFDGAAVVIGWAAEAAAAVWLGVHSRNRAFQFGGFALWILATFQLLETITVTPASFTLLFNARTFATAFVLVCGYAAAWRLSTLATSDGARMRTVLHILASALTIAWMTAEIQSFWEVQGDTGQGHLYEQMLLSLAWGVYGAVLIVVDMLRRFATLRYIGMTVIAFTSLKVFFYDLWELGGIYRVVGFLAFGLLLVLVSYLYQRKRSEPSAGQSPPPQSPPQSPASQPPESPPAPPSPA